MIREVNFEKTKQIYDNYMSKDFNGHELPSIETIKSRMENNLQKTYILEENNEILAYFISTELEGFVLILFLAVMKEQRGKGIGSKLLQELKNKYNDKKGIILEVEIIDGNDKEKEIKTKRINFYKKNEYILFNNIEYTIFAEKYHLMYHPINVKDISNNELVKSINKIYVNLLKEFYKDNVKYKIL